MTWPTATEYMEAIQNPKTCFRDPNLQDGVPALDRLGMPFVSSGQFAYVFKLKHATGKASAIRCFRGFLGDRAQRYEAIDKHLDSTPSPYLASFEYDPEGILVGGHKYPILVMEWIEGPTLDVYLGAALQDRAVILNLADQWIRLIKNLKDGQVAHGDLQHGNIIVQNGNLRLVDLDGMFVPSMSKMRSSELGHRHYQHPLRDELFFNGDLDNFSALVIYLSLISIAERPALWNKFHDENLIMARSDYLNPTGSPVFLDIKGLGVDCRRFLGILEKACQSSPSSVAAISDLVAPKSKLPAWMAVPSGVVITTKTREVIAGQVLSGALSSATAIGGSPHPWHAGSPTFGTQSPATPISSQNLSRQTIVSDATSIALKFGLTGILFSLVWFPVLNSLYRDLGYRDNSQWVTLWTYVLGCIGFGLYKALRNTRAVNASISQTGGAVPITTYVPPSQYRSGHQPIQPTPYIPRYTPGAHYTPRYTPQYQPASTTSPGPSPQPSLSSGQVVASKARHIYHRPTCEWARKIAPRNRISFPSARDALSAGYRKCAVCLPV